MAAMLPVTLIVIFAICFAMLISEGLWGNAITFFNVVTAALLANNYFEPAAALLEEHLPSFKYFVDFVALWLIFIVVYLILKLITERVSRVKVRFRKPVETAGGLAFAALVGWIMMSFSLMSFHMAPLEVDAFGGGFQDEPLDKMLFGMAAPDRNWLAFVYNSSNGGSLDRFGQNDESQNFDPKADFIYRYRLRREALSGEAGLMVK